MLKRYWFSLTILIAFCCFISIKRHNDKMLNDYHCFVEYKVKGCIEESLFVDKSGIYFCLYKATSIIEKLNNGEKLTEGDLEFLHRDINRFSTVKYMVLLASALNGKSEELKLLPGEMRLQYSPWSYIASNYDKISSYLTGEEELYSVYNSSKQNQIEREMKNKDESIISDDFYSSLVELENNIDDVD